MLANASSEPVVSVPFYLLMGLFAADSLEGQLTSFGLPLKV